MSLIKQSNNLAEDIKAYFQNLEQARKDYRTVAKLKRNHSCCISCVHNRPLTVTLNRCNKLDKVTQDDNTCVHFTESRK